MADPKVLEFFQQAEKNPELSARIRAVDVSDKARAFDALARIASDAGYAVSAAALEQGLRECTPGALSDDQLDGVSGGAAVEPCITKASQLRPGSTFGQLQTKLKPVEPCY